MKVRDLLSRYPKLWSYDYKWKNAENYMDLNEILEIIGYKLVDADTIAGGNRGSVINEDDGEIEHTNKTAQTVC